MHGLRLVHVREGSRRDVLLALRLQTLTEDVQLADLLERSAGDGVVGGARGVAERDCHEVAIVPRDDDEPHRGREEEGFPLLEAGGVATGLDIRRASEDGRVPDLLGADLDHLAKVGHHVHVWAVERHRNDAGEEARVAPVAEVELLELPHALPAVGHALHHRVRERSAEH
eukprot:4016179-Alexandrium_andersonii.AAC.1